MNKTPSSKHKIRFSDCDMFGHLNNSRYLDYMLDAREDHLKENYDFDLTHSYKNNLGWVVASHEIAYLRPALFSEVVSIESRLLFVDADGLQVEMIMTDLNNSHIKSVMRTRMIPVNLKTGKKDVHNPELLKWILSLVDNKTEVKANFQDRVRQLVTDLKESKADIKQ